MKAALYLALLTAVTVGAGVGLIPLLRNSPQNLDRRLREGSRGSSKRRSGLSGHLVVAQIALAVLVVSGAALLMNSMWRLQQVDLGTSDESHVLTFRTSLPEAGYQSATSLGLFYRDLVAGLEGMPGVESVGLVNRLPLLGGDNLSVSPHASQEPKVDFVSFRLVTAGYLDAVGASLIRGRWLSTAEAGRGPTPVVINETLARRLFPGQDPLGARMSDPFARDRPEGSLDDGLRIVGVIGDLAGGTPDRSAPPAFYAPFHSVLRPSDEGVLREGEQFGMSLVVRTVGDPYALTPSIRTLLELLDPEVPLFEVRTLSDIALARLGTRNLAVSLFGVFAGLALLLGAIGIYGVMSYGVAQRSRELGVRLALGATHRSVLLMVMKDGALLAGPGVVLGLILALASGRMLSHLLYEVSSVDPMTYGVVALVLGVVCGLAAYVPARRATKVDPLASIQVE